MEILGVLLGNENLMFGLDEIIEYRQCRSLDDHERYLQMSMKIDSSDPVVLERNENINDLQMSKRTDTSLRILFKLWTILVSKTKPFGPSRKRLWVH